MRTPSQRGKGHVLAVIAAVMVGGWLLAGCSAHVSIGRPSAVSKNTVETETASNLAHRVPDAKVVCPGDLKAEIGTVMYCSFTARGSTTAYPVKVQVDSLGGRHVHWLTQISQTPGHFTPPAMAKNSVETETATVLARQVHQPDPKVVCPGNLKAEIGTVMYCSLTPQGSTTTLPVKLQVDSLSASNVHFNITVSKTPGHFTAPG